MKRYKPKEADYLDYLQQYGKRSAQLSEDLEIQEDVYHTKEEYFTAIEALRYKAKMEAQEKGEKYHGKSAKQLNKELATNQITGTTVKQRKAIIEGIQYGEEERGEETGSYTSILKGFFYGKKGAYKDVYNDWKALREKEWKNFTKEEKSKLAKNWLKEHPNSRQTFNRATWERWLFQETFLGNRYLKD